MTFSLNSSYKDYFFNWIIPFGMIVFFVLYQSWPIFTKPQFYSDDQLSNWLLALRQHDPTFLSHDYVFGNPLFQGHYIPVYLFLLYTLIQIFGGIDGAMIFLHSIMLPAYLLSMFFLLRYITGQPLIAAFVAIASALSRSSIAQEIWAATDMRAVMPRTAFLVFVPLLCLLLFRWLPSKTWWHIPLLGLCIGLATNFHPPSGLFMLQISLTLVLFFSVSSFKLTIGKIILAGIGFAAGGLPTHWAVIRGILQSSQLTATGSFQEFAEAFHWRMRTEFPFPPEQVNFVGTPLTSAQQNQLVVVYLGLMGLWLGLAAWLKYGGHLQLQIRSRYLTWMLIGLLVINIPLAYLATTFLALDLILIVIAYWTVRLLRKEYDRLDIWALAILVCAGAYSFVLSGVLGWVWARFELWSLTSFFGEQARLSRYVYLPLFIFLARWLTLLFQERRERGLATIIAAGIIAGLAVRHWHFLDPWGPAEWGMGLALVVLAVAGVWLQVTTPIRVNVAALMIAISFSTTSYLWFYIVGVNLPLLIYLALGSGFLLGLTQVEWFLLHWRWLGLALTGLVIIWGVGWGPSLSQVDDPNFRAPLRTQAMKALGLYEYGTPAEWPDSIAFYEWARNNTEADDVFYYNDRQYEFRAFALRAVTHSWKDVGGGYYTPPLAIEYYRRFQKLEDAYQDPTRLLACAEVYGADYIVARDGQPPLDLPVAFSNERYLVYATDDSIKGDPSLCQ